MVYLFVEEGFHPFGLKMKAVCGGFTMKTYALETNGKPKLRYWAIRDSDYVEFRVWSKQPIKVVSRLIKRTQIFKREYYTDFDGADRWRMIPVPVQNVIEQVCYVGGKSLGIVKVKDIGSELSVPPNGRVEVTKQVKDSILRKAKSW
jgi:hypothetical protein